MKSITTIMYFLYGFETIELTFFCSERTRKRKREREGVISIFDKLRKFRNWRMQIAKTVICIIKSALAVLCDTHLAIFINKIKAGNIFVAQISDRLLCKFSFNSDEFCNSFAINSIPFGLSLIYWFTIWNSINVKKTSRRERERKEVQLNRLFLFVKAYNKTHGNILWGDFLRNRSMAIKATFLFL